MYVVLRNRKTHVIIYMIKCYSQQEIERQKERLNINLDKSKYEIIELYDK